MKKNRLPIAAPVAGVLLLALCATADAQQAGTANLGAADNAAAAAAGDLAITTDPAWIIKPRINLSETLTDNVDVNRSSGSKQSDQITELAPGIRIEAKTARLKGFFDYTARNQFYAQHAGYNRTQNSLNTMSTLEAVDNWLFVDLSGVIAQQSISAFGTQSTNTTSINSNSVETSTYRLSPYIRGRFAGSAEYLLRYSASTTRSDSAAAYNVDVTQWTGQLRGSTPFQKLKWTLDGNQQSSEYGSGRKNDADTLRAMGTYTVQPDFRVSLSGGSESNNYASTEQQRRATHGAGFDWTPTERTNLSVFKERRFFGDGHNVSFSHRFPQSSISYTDTKDVTVLPPQYLAVQSATSAQFSLQCPAGVDMSNITTTKAAIDARCWISMTPIFTTNAFQTSQATLQRRQQLSLALTGIRNTLTVMANRSESQSLLTVSSGNDDFAKSTLIHQQGLTLNLSHRLSEISELNLLSSRQQSTGSGGTTDLKTTTTMVQLGVTTKLSAKSSGSLNARRTRFDSTGGTADYSENAVIGAVSFVY